MLASRCGRRRGQAVQRVPAGRAHQAGEAPRHRGRALPVGRWSPTPCAPTSPTPTTPTAHPPRRRPDMTTTDGIEAVFLRPTTGARRPSSSRRSASSWSSRPTTTRASSATATGPYVFIAEVPEDEEPGIQLVLKVADADALAARPRRRGGHPVRGHPLRHPGDDRARPRRPGLEPPGAAAPRPPVGAS